MPKLTADTFITFFDRLFILLGPKTFPFLGLTQLHSGPHFLILEELFGPDPDDIEKARKEKSNYVFAERQARRVSAVRLEDTRPGETLEAFNVYELFKKRFPHDPGKGMREADKVWAHVSRRFIQALDGDVVTAVCGANKTGIFRNDELPELVLNSRIKTINGVPWQEIRDLYFSDPVTGPYKAFLLICRSELRFAMRHAAEAKTNEAIDEAYFRRTYYQIERRHTLTAHGKTIPSGFSPHSAAEHKTRLETLRKRIAAAGPIRSASKRPAIRHDTPVP